MPRLAKRSAPLCVLTASFLTLGGCAAVTAPYRVAKGAVRGGIFVVKTTYEVTAGTTRVIYRIGEYTYEVVRAPLDWALTHAEIESIDGLPAAEAIRRGTVKTAPYVVRGTTYVPLSVEEASTYREEGIASWYGYESGRMTATGEVFTPNGLSAAHKSLPIPMFVQVTNLENRRSLIVRVNDRGPFPSANHARSGGRLIDLSAGAAKRLGFYGKGTALVRVEAIQVKEE